MKKLVAFLLVLVLVLSATFILVACTPDEEEEKEKSAVQLAIEAAQSMTLEELENAAKAEMEKSGAVFNADSLTSGIEKALKKFAEKYDWLTYDENAKYNSKKGAEYQPKLTAADDAHQYIADFVMIQDAAFVDSLVKDGFLRSYVPSGEGFNIAEGDQQPLVGVTFNKVFMWNSKDGRENQLTNVWQLTGADGANGKKGVKNVSFQSPLGEDINMSFLIMLTSDDAVAKLTPAYQSYFGSAYDGSKDDYPNIGFKFAAEFIKNVAYWHSSDSDQIKGINGGYAKADASDGRVVFAGLCKLKDAACYKADPADDDYYTKIVKGAGWNQDVEGFPGFVYNMWTLIPDTARNPYTACLFVRYILSNEGYQAGWGNVLGYYSANQNIPSVAGDPALSVWKSKAIVEDVDYINSVYKTVVKFINQQLA